MAIHNTSPYGEITSGDHLSYWLDSVQPVQFEILNKNLATDVVIVGGGLAGVTIAYCLTMSGKKIVLVEDGYIGSGETGRTTAHLVTALDDRYYELARMYGEEKTKLIADSHRAAINFIENTVLNEKIECDFARLNGYLFLHPNDKKDSLEKELEAALKAGLNVEMIGHIPDFNEIGKSIKFSNQAQFHPLKYIKALCIAIEKNGGLIFTRTHATDIDSTGIITDGGYEIQANHVVVATNTPVNNKYVMHLKQYPYRTYVIGARIKKNSVVRALWWDTGDQLSSSSMPPYHYVRTQRLDDEYDLLICGGEDHQTGLAEREFIAEEDRYKLLEDWVRSKFKIVDLAYKWSGQVMEPMDSLAYIGRNPSDKENVYIVTGDSGNGMTHATIAGMLITDLINGKHNDWEKIYDPSRFKLFTAGKTFFKELIGGMTSYLKSKPDNVELEKLYSLKKDEGTIINIDNNNYGVYKDEESKLHMVSATCTHLHCTVKWNNDEKSWDCPCHGSRFTYEGKVINGPANSDLPYQQEIYETTEVTAQ